MLVCHNGTFIAHEDANISITNGGFLFGDTLFETFKAKQQNILLLSQHLDRLEHAAKLLNFPCARDKIEVSLRQLATALEQPTSRIRLTLSRGSFAGLDFPPCNHGEFLITSTDYTELTATERQTGATCMIAPNQRVNPLNHLPQMKLGNYSDCLYASNYAHRAGVREALFVDNQHHILEGATSNIFAMVEDRLITPPLGTLVLNGIMRQQVISTAAELGILVIEQDLPLAELMEADELFLTNSLIDILPITNIDRQAVNRGDCWKSLLKTFKMRIEA